MTLLLDKPTTGIIFPKLDEPTKGPEYLDVMLMGYQRAEDTEENEMILAINRDGKFNGFNNTLYVLNIFPAPKGHKEYVQRACGAKVDYLYMEKELEGARVSCEGKERRIEGRISDWNRDITSKGSAKRTWYTGKIQPEGKDYSYSSMVARDQEFPVERVKKDDIDKLIADEASKLSNFEQRIKEGQLNHKSYRELTQARMRINDVIAKSLMKYFKDLFSDNLDGWKSMGFSDKGWAMDVLPIECLFNESGYVSRSLNASLNEKSYWYGSIQDFHKVALEKVESKKSESKEQSKESEEENYYSAASDLGIRRDAYWQYVPEICIGLSMLPAAGLSYFADWDYGWIVPGVILADQLTRKAVSKVTGMSGAPGILGLAKTVGEYVSGLFKRNPDVA